MQVQDIFTGVSASGKAVRLPVWGWLEPGSAALPHVLLQGDEVALGRGIGEAASSQAAHASMLVLPDSPPSNSTGTAPPVAPAG